MKIEIDITPHMIADLMTSAIESGDPVTTYRKGGWCSGIYYRAKDAEPPEGFWYSEAKTYAAPDFQIAVHEVADESEYDPDEPDEANIAKGALVIHTITADKFRHGLIVMAQRFPHHFADAIRGHGDAATADILLQAICFGEEKYA